MNMKRTILMLSAITCLNITSNVQADPSRLTLEQRRYLDPTQLEIKKGLSNNEVTFDLYVDEIKNKLYNPSTDSYDVVELRGYKSKDSDPNAPYVAPSIRMVPGQTARVTLHNDLEDDPSCNTHPKDVNTPHCFNGTNLHTHGLWISPSGNSDNVLLKLNPGLTFQYEYNVPPDHPAGTFWYHPHLHGSTALQVSSGMVGALIIRGDRQPVVKDNKIVKTGDLDLLLKPFKEHTMVMQQIAYACFDENGEIITNDDGQWLCSEGQTGVIKDYKQQFAPGSWPTSGRYTSLNGQILPTISNVNVGDVERWRMIHAGVRDTISLEFRKRIGKPGEIGKEARLGTKDFLNDQCQGERLEYKLVASDGLTMKQAISTSQATFQPGYRWDLLVQYPEQGDWCMLDTSSSTATGAINNYAPTPQLLGIIQVGSSNKAPQSIEQQLIDSAEKNIALPAQASVIAEIKDGLKLNAFIPHKDLIGLPEKDFGKQALGFNIQSTNYPNKKTFFQVANQLPSSSDFDPQPYDPNRMDRNLILGSQDEWQLGSNLAGHPFHIHVNPFQITAIYTPEGKDVSALDSEDVYYEKNGARFPTKESCEEDKKEKQDTSHCMVANDKQYPGLKGLWKDTIFVKQGYKVVFRTKYERYIGDFVLHCHILDHEDQGMMQNVRIGVGDGTGKIAFAHGSHSFH
ncbi:multicopper oxidase family protein [Marinomonas spartinae]|uniref:multicopper oxidase family protein n=1 Tax=Marinomonas spartinae TaxID=1792290 RepID=UPI0018F22DA5|nr:multicopper oxidase family protein [Marinomonas spartinae]MBJ7553852.1 multicopper oxidase domain-containing protein [Marinomonas spartinae]